MSYEIDAALSVLDSKPLDFEVAKARALMIGYHERWRDTFAEYEVIEVESEFRFALVNPATKTRSRSFDEAGKIDGVLQHRRNGRYVVLEHKTTADDIDNGSDYWSKLQMDTQCTKYILALRFRKLNVGNLLYDVIHKPGSRPRQIPQLDEEGVKIVLDANGTRVRTANGKKWRETGDTERGWVLQSATETPEQYGARLLSEIRAEPDCYFAHREVARLDSDLLEYMEDAWMISQEILFRRHSENWSRNPDACMRLGKCEFYDLCTGRASVDGVRFAEAQKHPELAMRESDDRQFLTTSRLAALRRCARYHYNRYEHPIKSCGEESEALRFGSLIHEGFEAYFRALREITRERES